MRCNKPGRGYKCYLDGEICHLELGHCYKLDASQGTQRSEVPCEAPGYVPSVDEAIQTVFEKLSALKTDEFHELMDRYEQTDHEERKLIRANFGGYLVGT